MTNHFRAAMYLGFLACSPSFAADLYRCDFSDGRIVYQGSQCPIGVNQRAIDSENARREQIQKSMEQERQRKWRKSAARTTAG